MKNKIMSFLFWFIIVLSFLLYFSAIWTKNSFNIFNFDSVIYHLSGKIVGTSKDIIYDFIKGPLVKTILVSFIFVIIFKIDYNYKPFLTIRFFNKKKYEINVFNFLNKHRCLFSNILLIIVLVYVAFDFKIIDYYRNIFSYSEFIEEHYVDPAKVNINFNNKKNLIHIYVESLEHTFLSKEYGGAYDENLLPNLSRYMKDEVSFSNKNNSGFYSSRATEWTIASMVAQTSGVGLITTIEGNLYGINSSFLPGAYSMGEILEKEGYNQTLLIGSDADFGGRKSYFTQHGNYVIKDYLYAVKEKWIPDDYYVWWGYEDSKLFDFAKEELKLLANENKPFNLTLLTTNTHHIGGYLEDSCEVKYDEQLKNVVLCSDKQIYNFVEWVKKQSFYKNTLIVITGDHLSMEPTFFDNIGDYERTTFNLFINANKKDIKKNNRTFCTLDLYPTILSSIGANIEGDRLGLGTNLFSKGQTLYEEYGREYVDNEYKKTSLFYNENIVK